MTPIEKNIIVVDEHGKEYEATFPKRAKGLVKNGRARFISNNMICLACPPNNILEDNKMSEKFEPDIQNLNTAQDDKFSMNYVLEQIEKIMNQTDYLNSTIDKLGLMDDGCNADTMSPGNTLGQAKAQALGDVVRCRETTNQQLLKIYEKMYDDIKAASTPKSNIINRFDEMADWLKTLNKDELPPGSWQAIQEAVKSQLCRNF